MGKIISNGIGYGGGGGNSNIVDTENPSQSVGNENDLYFKSGGTVGYYHYIVSTVSTSDSDAVIQVQEVDNNGSIIETTVLHHGSSWDWTEFDGHFKVKYTGPNWDVVILDDNLVGYETGDTISWAYYSAVEYDLKLPVSGDKITNQYIKINNNWVGINNTTVTQYVGVPNLAKVQNDGECTLIKIETDKYIIYQLLLKIHMNGTDSGQQYTQLYTFPSGVIDDLNGINYLVYAVSEGFYWSRVQFRAADNSISGFWGTFTINDGWYGNTPFIYIIPKNL